MQIKLWARPYAEALYSSLKQSTELKDQVLAEYKALVDLAKEDAKFRIFLETPSISQATKETFLEKALRGKCHDQLVDFVKVLARKGRLFLLSDIYNLIEDYLELEGAKKRVQVTTAVPLSDENRDTIKKQLESSLKADVILQEFVDPNIIGGFIVRVEDTLIDASLQHHLSKMKNQILERSRSYGI